MADETHTTTLSNAEVLQMRAEATVTQALFVVGARFEVDPVLRYIEPVNLRPEDRERSEKIKRTLATMPGLSDAVRDLLREYQSLRSAA